MKLWIRPDAQGVGFAEWGLPRKSRRVFADGVRSRGRSYFDKGRVVITSAKAGQIVVAKVRGTDAYRVKLRVRGSKLHASCTCLYFGPHGEPCKHIWATILVADARQLLQSPPNRPLAIHPRRPLLSRTTPN